MKKMGLIVAMNEDRVIGVNNTIPWHYSNDMTRFKYQTVNSAVIMGRKTWESIGSRPLLNRRNIVISNNEVQNIEHYNNLEDAINVTNQNIWIIGGAEIYKLAMPYVDFMDVTIIPDQVEEKENIVRFPEIDLNIWKISEEMEMDHDLKNLTYTRIRQRRITIPASDVGMTLTISEEALREAEKRMYENIGNNSQDKVQYFD